MNEHAKVLFFATLRDKTGVRETEIEFQNGSTIADIKAIVLKMYPNLQVMMDTVIVAMNHEYAFDENPVVDGAEVAFFPPVSGGSDKDEALTVISIVDHEIDINDILMQITTEKTGAACIFSGIVRGITRRGIPHQTEALEYEAYRDMAQSKMRMISDEIRSRWIEIEGIALVQRIGGLSPGEISVVIGCTSPHRDSGIFEAAHYGIDRLKEIVPIWKKEIGPSGEEWVEGEYYPRKGD